MELLFKSYNDYALPVKMNVDFNRRAEDIIKENSFIAIEHPQILNEFSNIIGGDYISGSNGSTYFRPKNKSFKFTIPCLTDLSPNVFFSLFFALIFGEIQPNPLFCLKLLR